MPGYLMAIQVFFLITIGCLGRVGSDITELNCDELLMGQYQCNEPEIDPKTQSARGCTKEHTVEVKCYTALGLTCKSNGKNSTEFTTSAPCRYTNGHSYETALLLSIFLGMFGIDRFYLGYPAIGLLKFCTLGFFFIFQLVDILLIATQIVGPADESDYVIDYYGPRLIHIVKDNITFYKPH